MTNLNHQPETQKPQGALPLDPGSFLKANFKDHTGEQNETISKSSFNPCRKRYFRLDADWIARNCGARNSTTLINHGYTSYNKHVYKLLTDYAKSKIEAEF